MNCLQHVIFCLVLIYGAGFAIGCSTNPATGRRQFLLVSQDEVSKIGAQAAPELIKEYGGEVTSSELRTFIDRVGWALAEQVEREYAYIKWEFTLLDSDVINAFALPGGKVFMSRGLLEKFNNEAQVAGVLGHEIGHVVGRHVDERLSQAMAIQGIGSVAASVAGEPNSNLSQIVGMVVGAGGQGYLLKFGRDQESESDVLGLKYMTQAGYDPHGMIEVLEVLRQAAAGPSPPEFFSTHPHPKTRLRKVHRLLKEPYAFTQNNPDFRNYATRFETEASPYLTSP